MITQNYKPSRTLMSFPVSGFAYWDGVDIISEVSVGDKLTLQIEPDNPYDPQAVALYYNDTKIGYVPRDMNENLSKLLYYGYDIFETKVSQVDANEKPYKQISAVIRVKDS